MVLQSNGTISFSEIQTEFGGTNPISFSEYYTDNSSGYTTGAPGLVSTGNPLTISNFYSKSKPVTSLPVDITFNYTGGVQTWTATSTRTVTLTLVGARGGNSAGQGGAGGYITADVNVVSGTTYNIVVGGTGTGANPRNAAGGGGGTGFQAPDGTYWIIAGGGGGSGASGGGGNGGVPFSWNGGSTNVSGGGATGGTSTSNGYTIVGRNRYGTGQNGSGINGGRGVTEGGSYAGGYGAGTGGAGGSGGADYAGGGGGGGWFGGAGASHGTSGNGPGGGGGSSYYNPSFAFNIQGTSQSTNNGNGWLRIFGA